MVNIGVKNLLKSVKPCRFNNVQGNTEGRQRISKVNAAYIAGFLDGDGSIRVQLQPRKNTFRVRTIISFAQKWGKEIELKWIKNQLGIGYLYKRNDQITELKIEGFKTTERILKFLKPYVRFKKKQLIIMLEILDFVKKAPVNLIKIAELSDQISNLNYVTGEKKYTAEYVAKTLKSCAPVTTDSKDEIV